MTQPELITRVQALEAGLSDDQIGWRVRSGRWSRLHHGVYDTTGGPPDPMARMQAALLAAGDEAVLSHTAAAAAWGMIELPDGPVHVSVPVDRHPRSDGLVVHRRRLVPRDRTAIGKLAVTEKTLTLVDVAHAAPQLAGSALDAGLRRGTVDGHRLGQALQTERFAGVPGVPLLRELLGVRGVGIPESQLETDTLQLIRKFRIPMPHVQYWVMAEGKRYRVDLAYPDDMVAIELDGAAIHGTFAYQQSDRQKDIVLRRGGWNVLRFTWYQVHHEELYVAYSIASALPILPTGWRRVV